MSTTYAGIVGNEIPSAVEGVSAYKSITGTTGGGVSPIVVTTSAAHGLALGEFVVVADVAGNTAANGGWFVSPTAADKLALYEHWSGGSVATPSTGNSAWTSGGDVRPQGWISTTTIPSDGDPQTAASINTPLEALLDRSAWLAQSLPKYRLVDAKRLYKSAATPTTSTGLMAVPAASVWAAPSPLNLNLYGGVTFNGSYFDVLPGDLFDVSFNGFVAITGGGSFALRISYEAVDYGVNFTGVATAGMLGSAKTFTANTSVALITKQTISSGTHGKKLIVLVQDYLVSGSPSYQLNGDAELSIMQYRPNF